MAHLEIRLMKSSCLSVVCPLLILPPPSRYANDVLSRLNRAISATAWHVPPYTIYYIISNLDKTFYLILAEKLADKYVLIMLRGRIIINRLLVKQACYGFFFLFLMLLLWGCATKRCNRSCAKFEGKQST